MNKLVLAGSFALVFSSLHAANLTWTGATDTSFSNNANWSGGLAPADSLTTDLGVFSGAVTANLPQLTASQAITGLSFSTATGGWTFSSNSTDNTLAIGASGISSTNTSGTNLVSANLGLGANQTWNVSTGGTLLVTGNITTGSSGSPANQTWTLGGAGGGTVVLDPSAGNSVNIYSSAAGPSGVLSVAKNVVFGSTTASTNSTNVIAGTVAGSTAAIGLRVPAGGRLTVNSGTWITTDMGFNSGASMAGNVTLNGGTLATGSGRYLISANAAAGGTFTVNGGTLRVTGSGNNAVNAGSFQVGAAASGNATGATINFNVQNGLVDVAKSTGSANGIGTSSITGTPNVLLNQSGGVLQIGVTTATNVLTGASANNTGTGITIGSAGNATAGTRAAFTLTGGNAVILGTIAGVAPAGNSSSVSNLNFMGGTLTAQTINVSNLGSSPTATATANQTVASTNVGTLVNYGGNLAPGGNLVSYTTGDFGATNVTLTPTAGRTSITGNYSILSSNATLSINIGGLTTSTAFQEIATSTRYSNVIVSGNVLLDGNLQLTFLNGFTPAVSDAFTILTSTAGAVSGTFANAASNYTLTSGDFSYDFGVTYNPNNVTLMLNAISPVPEPSVLALLGLGALFVLTLRRRRVNG